MKRYFIGLILISTVGFAQKKIVSLDSCIHLAKTNYPQIKENGVIASMEKNTIKGINKNWLPKLSFMGEATYQSEVTSFNLPEFGNLFPIIPKGQYAATVELEQTLYDAGQLHQQKKVEHLNAENELRKNEVDLYKLVDRVNQLYSAILLSRANLSTLNIYLNDISNKKEIIGASVKNGMSLQSNLDELEVEALKTEQSIAEARENIGALYQSRHLLINQNLDDSTEFSLVPIGGAAQGQEINRPELKWFDSQKNLLEAKHALINKAALPKLSLIGEGIYGEPGYNFLDVNGHFFGKAGIALKWNIGSLYSLGVEHQNLVIGQQQVDIQKEVFEFNLKSQLADQAAQINSIKLALDKDKLILEKRHAITASSSSQLENGSITTSAYLIELNAEMQALLNQRIHEIKFMNAVTGFNATKGISNF